MDKRSTKPGQAAVKNVPLKPSRKKRRGILGILSVLCLLMGIIGAGFYYRLIPLDPDTAAKIEPYLVRMEERIRVSGEYLENLIAGKKADETAVGGKPKTNFPLVELDEKKPAPATTVATSSILGSPAVAAASPAQPSTGAAKPVAPSNDAAAAAKTYSKLSKLYGAMKPEEAAAVFSNLEDEQVVPILLRMDEEAAGKVLATMEPRRAARLTQAMIKRK